MNKVIFWDFHGTLAINEWMFSKALCKVLNKYEPDNNVCIEEFKKQPLKGFPWQEHEKDYSHLTNSDAWWKHAEKIFAAAYKGFNITEEKSFLYAEKVRYELIKPDEFLVYEDTIETLDFFKNKGYVNIILSNHIPELPEIVELLGLDSYIEDCISSANVGYEKPNPKIYSYALEKVKHPQETWMVGDSYNADVKGPESAGIKGILVRSSNEYGIENYSKDLKGVRDIIL